MKKALKKRLEGFKRLLESNKYLEKFVNNGNLQTNDARRNRKYRKQVTT